MRAVKVQSNALFYQGEAAIITHLSMRHECLVNYLHLMIYEQVNMVLLCTDLKELNICHRICFFMHPVNGTTICFYSFRLQFNEGNVFLLRQVSLFFVFIFCFLIRLSLGSFLYVCLFSSH